MSFSLVGRDDFRCHLFMHRLVHSWSLDRLTAVEKSGSEKGQCSQMILRIVCGWFASWLNANSRKQTTHWAGCCVPVNPFSTQLSDYDTVGFPPNVRNLESRFEINLLAFATQLLWCIIFRGCDIRLKIELIELSFAAQITRWNILFGRILVVMNLGHGNVKTSAGIQKTIRELNFV